MKHQIQAYERITIGKINAQANLEEAALLSRVGMEQARMQALIGAVQMRLDSQTKSEEIEALRQVELAKTITSAETTRFETARAEAEAAIAIVDRISRAKTEQELIKYAATVAVFSQY